MEVTTKEQIRHNLDMLRCKYKNQTYDLNLSIERDKAKLTQISIMLEDLNDQVSKLDKLN